MSTNTQTSFQWMIPVGVAASDVKWLEAVQGSVDLHTAAVKARIERIYKTAIYGVLASPCPASQLLMALN